MNCFNCGKEISDDEWVVNWTACSDCFSRSYDEYLENKDMTKEQIENNFTYHAPKNDQPMRYEELRAKAKELAFHINSTCPESREKALALTNLEQSIFWANASIARNE